ncbi:MAG: FKBP-type peptidyl-prolyl cis-trans isomerase [Salinivirgaceae bacterium]|nr:FKBP-type peptidyl-prolyl cis-trans isomerase [Salinivirgaceae bacterium]
MRSLKFETLVAIFLFVALQFASCQHISDNFSTTQSGLKYKISSEGKGEYPKLGDKLWLHYVGKFTNDSVFASTLNEEPLDITLGLGQVIKGWEEGLKKIKPGGEITLIVPPDLAYGDKRYKNIPANSTLIFEIALVQVNKGYNVKPFNIEGLKAQTGNKKLQYYVVQEGSGLLAQLGDNAYVHFTGYLPDGTIFDSSYKNGDPVRITVGIKQIFEGWDIGLAYMKKGSKYRFIIPPKIAYGKAGFGNSIPPNTTITLDVEMLDLVPPPIVEKWDISEKQIIETTSGLKYVIFEEGQGDLIEPENVVFVNYSGYFTNGELFDSSVKRFEPIQIPVGAGAVIDGWEEALQLMRKGSKFQLIIPSHLAYGEEGAPPQIAPNTDLIFDIEVLEVLK